MHDLVPNRYNQIDPTAPIGVFDSGVGGLTVLREIEQQLPAESVLYFGDTARVPYGNRSDGEIIQFVRETLDWMQQEQVKMAIMACNTSSAVALSAIVSEYNFPILGVIHPGARAAARQSNKIGVISTPVTARSNAYLNAIREANPDAQVWQVGCPEFVPLIEADRIDDPYTLSVAKKYIEPLLDLEIDTLIYGCTHYPHLAPVFQKFIPPSVKLINPAEYVVKAAIRELKVLGIQHKELPTPTRFTVSGDALHFANLASRWLTQAPIVEQITLPSILV
jgi:glutamate racemase